ncbi:L-2-haloalkanoic acid dehalogenase [invertebrate metagenome]|uniref:L-2-haloalkanoic acid dehalogenase n=1 Tax=invertebrate metagenome TaxID=1711999 RepID=A0A484H6Q4_9ZZZZ
MYTPVVFFDIGATLIEGPAFTPAQQIATRLGFSDTTRRRLDQQLLTSMINTPDALVALLMSAYAVPAKTAADLATMIWQSQIEGPKTVPGGMELLSALRATGIQYGFISNIWFPYATTFARLYGKLAETDLAFFSFRAGLMKPDLGLFQKAIATANCLPRACIMIGDSYDSDIRPAIALGMQTVWFLCRPAKEQLGLERVRQKIFPTPNKVVSSLIGLNVATVVSLTTEAKMPCN